MSVTRLAERGRSGVCAMEGEDGWIVVTRYALLLSRWIEIHETIRFFSSRLKVQNLMMEPRI